MKLVKSKCEKAWFFNATKRKEEFTAGMACFMPNCERQVAVELNGFSYLLEVPSRAIQSNVPIKIINARLPLLISGVHE